MSRLIDNVIVASQWLYGGQICVLRGQKSQQMGDMYYAALRESSDAVVW